MTRRAQQGDISGGDRRMAAGRRWHAVVVQHRLTEAAAVAPNETAFTNDKTSEAGLHLLRLAAPIAEGAFASGTGR
jgi:hypothetical protein